MTNYTPGFYWVLLRNNPKPTIARLRKSSGWEMLHSEHTTKACGNKPYKVLEKIECKHEKVYTEEQFVKDLQTIHGKEEGLKQYNEIMERERQDHET